MGATEHFDVDQLASGTPGDLADFFATTQVRVHADAPQLITWMKEELGWLRERNPNANVPVDLQRYRLDGDELFVRDDSLGELVNFVRKVRTVAHWDGHALKTETETVSESIDARTGAVKMGRGITSILTFRLGADDHELLVERTGFRAQPPSLLYGQPYDRATDLAYNVDRVRYVKATTR